MTQLKQSSQAFRAMPKAFGLLWRASPTYLLLTAGAVTLQGILPAIIALVAKLIVDHLVASRGPTPALWWLVGLEAVLALAVSLIRNASDYFATCLRERAQLLLGNITMRQASDLDLAFFEMPGNYDNFSKARREIAFRPFVMGLALFGSLQNLVGVLSFFVVVFAFQPLLALALLAAAVPTLIAGRVSGFVNFQTYDLLTPEGRRAAYAEALLTQNTYAKELRLFGLSQMFIEQFQTHGQTIMQGRTRAAAFKARNFNLAATFSVTIQYAALAFVVWRAALGQVTIGDFTLLVAALVAVRQQLSEAFGQLAELLENSLFFRDLTDFLALKPEVLSPEIPLPLPSAPAHSLALQDLVFAYPGTDKRIFDGLSLELRAGEATALVGVNGAGKTTLVKLLTRLYDPLAGRIMLDGTDIRKFDLQAYRAMFGVILQDFTRYQLSARENIVLNATATDDDRLNEVGEAANLQKLVANLPDGWDTSLGRQFHVRGQDLSGGEWQRVALARALYRDAPVLILDEPTAALDAEAEAELFQQYRSLTHGRLSLLITHRFNTVKMADRILVMEHGQVIEDGTHPALLELGGRYAEMFLAQAAAYDLMPVEKSQAPGIPVPVS